MTYKCHANPVKKDAVFRWSVNIVKVNFVLNVLD